MGSSINGQNYSPLVLLIGNVVLNVSGSVCLKQAAVSTNAVYAALGCGFYVLRACIFIILLQSKSLAVMGFATSILGLVMVIAVGIVFFDETLQVVQWSGVVLALVSVTLIAIPSLTS